ncbi:MAG: FliA/WhiG family RNA polymerase sigma factor [Clostridia bacterium]|nr:FliA/WhiG family RNA polymerase sigma factor [Clostridia bacterium]
MPESNTALQEKEKREQEAQALWDAYEKDRSVENGNRLVEHYLYMVRRVVMRMQPSYNSTFRDYDDLVSNGVLGLIDAVKRFEPGRNIKFETYAPQRIRGAILDYMRAQDWVPANTRKDIKRLRAAQEKLTAELGHEPSQEELAEYLGVDPSVLDKISFHDYQSSVIHFESIMGGQTYQAKFQEPEAMEVADDDKERMPEESFLERETKMRLAQILRELPEKEQMVLDLYYNKELRLKDIADIMGLTESRISQIHRAAIRKISKKYMSEVES